MRLLFLLFYNVRMGHAEASSFGLRDEQLASATVSHGVGQTMEQNFLTYLHVGLAKF